jgi:hypothetical protein
MAWIGWGAVITALDSGQLPSSGTEKRMLRMAASLAGGYLVSLREKLDLQGSSCHCWAPGMFHSDRPSPLLDPPGTGT